MPVAAATFCTFIPYPSQFCDGNPIMQTRDGSACTGGLTKIPEGPVDRAEYHSRTNHGRPRICSRDRLLLIMWSWAPGGVAYLSAFLCLSLQSEESSCQSLQAAIITLLSLSVWLHLSSSQLVSLSSSSSCRSISLISPYLFLHSLFPLLITQKMSFIGRNWTEASSDPTKD